MHPSSIITTLSSIYSPLVVSQPKPFHYCFLFYLLLCFLCILIFPFLNEKMTMVIEQPRLDSHAHQESHVRSKETNELVLHGGFPLPKSLSHNGFIAPHINPFGHSFRDYDAESERQQGVEQFYKLQHTNQTYDFVKRMREEYGKLDKVEMGIWECCELLNDVVDDSDPDLDQPQIQHLLQSAEAIRKDYPQEDWLHLTALIHDLGKILLLPAFGQLPQWAVVGDTFPLGCAFDESNVHHKYFKDNPDYNNPAYSTRNGIYNEGCGLDNVMISWGHDDYMYLVAKENGTTLPSAALFIIRYHSFYPLHREGAYMHLMNEEDAENLKWLKIFNKYDLYSKSNVQVDVEKVKPYYLSLIKKYFPEKLRW
ncbi:inositol oxygenase 4-like isoform X2 [Prosopis cineraria]|uniref:inositol oxygenase 4-like isoform X2 n=1 Tax=Prosopis cineraria TaxID=364024 RepID=UPI00240FD55C|nr:inositol oxygenase 4-like isoform X2 [Prosopis cineraria]